MRMTRTRKAWMWSLLALGLAVGVAGTVGLAAEPQAGLAPGARWAWRQNPLLREFALDQVQAILALRDELNLTEVQKAQLKEVFQAWRPEFRPALQKAGEKKRALGAAIAAEPVDEAAIRAAGAELGQAIGEAAVVASKFVNEARSLLTPEQLQKIAEYRAQKEQARTDMASKIQDQGAIQ